MSMKNYARTTAWMQALAGEVTKPVFTRLPLGVRPYLLGLLLFAAAGGLLSVGNAALLRYGLPWALVSLLVVVAAANLWGVGPAVWVLALSALYGIVVVPRLLPFSFYLQVPAWQVLLLRTGVFTACGVIAIWLTDRASQMQAKAETRRGVVMALQSMILPERLPRVPGYDLCGLYQPARHEEEVGGDFYDLYPLGDGQYGLLIGDVMGKGKEAAAFTALLRYSARAFSSADAYPAWIMGQLNTLIETQEIQFETASLFLGFLDTRSGTLRYANAGHEPPLLKRADGREEVLGSTGPILGCGLRVIYEENVVFLRDQDSLLLMTDGVTEARSEQGEFLGDGTWPMFRAALNAPSAERALAALDLSLNTYRGANRSDDIAMLLLRRTPNLPMPNFLTWHEENHV